MPLNTVLAAPPLEANEMALNVFEENELQIGPEEELVSDDEEEIARKAALKREREIKNEKERERKRRIKVHSFFKVKFSNLLLNHLCIIYYQTLIRRSNRGRKSKWKPVRILRQYLMTLVVLVENPSKKTIKLPDVQVQ